VIFSKHIVLCEISEHKEFLVEMCECDIKQDQKVFEAVSECAAEKSLF
jgi:hypothetical protein